MHRFGRGAFALIIIRTVPAAAGCAVPYSLRTSADTKMLRLLALAALAHAQNASRIEYNVLIVGDVHDDLQAIDELVFHHRAGQSER